MSDTNLQEYMAEIMSAEYRQVIDNMLLNNEFGKPFQTPFSFAGKHEVEVEFDE